MSLLGASEVGGTDVMTVPPPTAPVAAAVAGEGNNAERLRATDLASHANLLRPVPTENTRTPQFKLTNCSTQTPLQ